MTTIKIPTPLRRFAGDARSVQVEAKTVDEALEDLVRNHEGLRPHLFDDEGNLRNFVNVYLNERDVRTLDQGDTQVGQEDTLVIVPSIAGGTGDAGPQGATSATTVALVSALPPKME